MSISKRRGLTARELLFVLTDIPEDMPDFGVDSCSFDADEDFILAADESSSSNEDEYVNAENMLYRWSSNICIFVFFQVAFVFCFR